MFNLIKIANAQPKSNNKSSHSKEITLPLASGKINSYNVQANTMDISIACVHAKQ